MHSLCLATVLMLTLAPSRIPDRDGQELKFSECPAAVQKTFQAEAKGMKIETVTKEKEEDQETVYWAEVTLAGLNYEVGVLEDGTLSEMNLTVDEEEVAFDKSPAPVQATFKAEGFGSKVATLGKDLKYGMPIYEAIVDHKGKSYQIIVAEDGTLVEKVLVIDDEEIDLAMCPAAVKTAFHDLAKGGPIRDVTRSTGIGKPTYEAEVGINKKVYLVEVSETGHLISKSLEAAEE